MKKQSRLFRQLMLATTLSFGMLVVGLVVFGFVATIGIPFFPPCFPTMLDFTVDGEPYLQRWDPVSQTYVFTDLDGHPLKKNPPPAAYSRSHSTGLGYPPPSDPNLRLPWGMRIQSFAVNDRQVPISVWYLIHDIRTGGESYLVGYSVKTKQRIGFVGRAGFRRESLPREEWFAVKDHQTWYTADIKEEEEYDYASDNPYTVVLNCGARVLGVDLQSHQVRVILGDPATPVRSIGLVNKRRHSYLAMLTDEVVDLVDPDGQRQTFSLPPELRGRTLTIAMCADGGLTVEVAQPQVFGSPVSQSSIYVLSADGTVSPPRDVNLDSHEDSEGGWFLLFGSPTYELSGILLSNDQWERYEGVHSGGQYTKLVLWRERWWILSATLEGAILAAICYRRQSRFRVPTGQRIVWPVFVFLFGFVGWIGYRFCRHWPVVEPCPACQKPSPRNAEFCAVCGCEFPLPEMKGTEIFA